MTDRPRENFDIHAVCALREPFRFTPLLCTAIYDQWETVEFLILKGVDLSRISNSRPLHFDFAQAHSEISVDEKGTQARSLFTMGGYLGGGLIPEELHVDRPFVFLIHDLKTGQILFMGRVMDPEEF